MTVVVARCAHCGERFFRLRSDQRFGSPACRRADWTERHPEAARSALERMPRPVRCRSTVFYAEPFHGTSEAA